MSQTVDGSVDEDRSSLRSSGSVKEDRSSLNGGVKETVGLIRSSLRSSIRRVAEKIPLSPGSKGSKVTDQSGPQLPSPTPSSGSSLASPLKNVGGFFSKKEEDEDETTLKTGKGLTHSKTEPNLSRFSDSFRKKMASGRRSLRLSSKKKAGVREGLGSVSEGSTEERTGERREEEEEVEEVEEDYVLPAIPDVPLSVMQISKLVELAELEEAHLHLLALRQEFQQEQRGCGEEALLELGKKEKDLALLYGDLRSKTQAIVRDSTRLPSISRDLLLQVARVVQEEERRAEEPGGLPGSWMESWREAVEEGVRAKVEAVPLERREQNVSWLAIHLGQLGKAVVEDLVRVRRELRGAYPPSFRVFSTYVSSYHRVVGRHLEQLEAQTVELKDLHALLNWTINGYTSERIMASASLQPDMEEESKELQLRDGLLEQLRHKYCCRAEEEVRSSLDRILQLQDEDLWRERRSPEEEDGLLCSQIHMDIWMMIEGLIKTSGQIDEQLKLKVICCCMKELQRFPRSFQAELRRCCGALRPQRLWSDYHITYINSFAALQQHMDRHRDACPDQVDGFRQEAQWLIRELMKELEDQFKLDVQPYLRRMMTRTWMTNDEDFRQLHSRTASLDQQVSLMRPDPAQELASRLHYHVVREFIGQLVKGSYSCRNRKHERAAEKMRQQWEELRDLFQHMKSTQEWLHPVGEDLSHMIGLKNKRHIKDQLEKIVRNYPDFSKKHLVAVLHFRGVQRGREFQLILRRLAEVKRTLGSGGDQSRLLFTDMPVTVNTSGLASLLTPCLSLLPHS